MPLGEIQALLTHDMVLASVYEIGKNESMILKSPSLKQRNGRQNPTPFLMILKMQHIVLQSPGNFLPTRPLYPCR